MAKMVRMTLDEAERVGRVDKAKLAATTDEDIARQIAEDSDLAPDLSELEAVGSPDVKAVRMKLGMNQEAFASALRLPVATVRNWEQKRTDLGAAGMSLMMMVDRDADAVFRLLGSTADRSGRVRRANVEGRATKPAAE